MIKNNFVFNFILNKKQMLKQLQQVSELLEYVLKTIFVHVFGY